MRLLLEVKTGPRKGHKFVLVPGQKTTLGRTGRADMTFSDDASLSSVHLQLELSANGGYVTDLQSTNGTFVNDERVNSRRVRDGDVLRAGATVFTIHLQGDAETPEDNRATAPLTASQPLAVFGELFTCRSGVHACRVPRDQMELARVLDAMRPHCALTLVFSPNPNDPELPVIDKPVYLLDWLPTEALPSDTPLLILPDDRAHSPELLLEAAWGKNAVVAVFSPTEDEPPCEQLRAGAGAFAKPSLLRPQLEQGPPAFVETLLRGLDAVLVEDQDPDSWLLYGREPWAERLGIRAK